MTEQVSGWLEGPDGVEAVNAPKHRSTAHSVDIAFPNGETPTIAVDGVDVAKLTTSMVIFAQAGRGPKVCLELSPHDLGIRSDAATVEVGGATHDLLVKLGWTPPAAPKTPVAPEGNGVQH